MRHITWCRLLVAGVVGVLLPSIAGQAQAPQAQVPQATVRELATIEGQVWEWVLLPSRRTLIYALRPSSPTTENSTFTYDVATKRSSLLGTNIIPDSVSSSGDRLAFRRSSEDGTGNFVWTMPIDPRSGIATGQAQRVSLRPSAGGAKFSPDGKMLVFRPDPGADGTWDVVLVPATGGPERVVANYPTRVLSYGWSADGKSLYVERPSLNPPTVIERVPVEGSRSEPLIPWTPITNGQPVGLSPDGRVAFIHENPDRFFYRTASGLEGEISVALPQPYDNGDVLNMRLESMRFTAMTNAEDQRVRVLDLATGQARDLLPGNVPSSTPAWSPDGRRLALLVGNRSHYDVAIMNADGSGQRRYPLQMHLDGWGGPVWETPWSPDGRFLALATKDRQGVGWSPYDQHQIALLDVASGEARVLLSSSMPGDVFRNFVWRSDGKAIRTIKQAVRPTMHWPMSIVEVSLDGTQRVLRDISAEFPQANRNAIVFVSDREVVLAVTVDTKTDRFLVPLDGNAARRLPDLGNEPGLTANGTGTPVAGNRLMIALSDGRGERPVIKFLSTAGDATRTFRLPFGRLDGFMVLANGEQVIVAGRTGDDAPEKVYIATLDGGALRLVGEIPRRSRGRPAPSPDGKLLAYTSDGNYAPSKIFEVDLGPALETIMKR